MIFLWVWLLTGAPAADYAFDNENWNGLSRFWQDATQLGLDIHQTRVFDWAHMDPKQDALFFLSSEMAIPTTKLWVFLHQGGRAVVAEDFRGGIRVFSELGLGLEAEPENFPHAVPIRQDHPLTQGLKHLVSNHPASFVPLPEPLWAFPESARALVLEVPVGAGQLLLVSDPSLFINDMWLRGDNRRFARRLLMWLGESGRRIHVLVDYVEYNMPVFNDSPSVWSWRARFIAWVEDVRSIFGGGLFWRLLGVFFLGPFLYVLLSLAIRSPFQQPMPPPRLGTRFELSRLWLRVMALSELLSRRLELSSVWYSVPSGRLREQLQKRFGGNTSRMDAFIRLAREIAQTMNAAGVRSTDYGRLSQWVEELEDFLRDFSATASNSEDVSARRSDY